MTMRVRMGAPGTSTQKLTVVSLDASTTVSATCSGGSVAVGTTTDRWNSGGLSISATTITISGLSAWTPYTYTVTQGSDSVSGSFRTLPGDQTTDYCFVVSTCDGRTGQNHFDPYSVLRGIMSKHAEPLICQFHIDDVYYCDGGTVNDADSGIIAGVPQAATKGSALQSRYYAAGWAASFGLFTSSTPCHDKWNTPDRQWVYQNLPHCCSGGDHAIAGNWCRGEIGASDYHQECVHGAGGTEEAAKAEWDAFYGAANPTPATTDEWDWTIEMGPVRFALFDYSLHSVPYEAGVATDTIGYGSTQITNIMNYMDVDTVPFKCFFHESHPYAGQGWWRWCQTEADGWHTDFIGSTNLKGGDGNGNAFCVSGDNHAIMMTEFDTFTNFCPGMLNSNLSVDFNLETEGSIAALDACWEGQNKFYQQGYATQGDRVLGGWWHFKVLASASPKKIEARCYSAIDGSLLSGPWTLEVGATDNKWTTPAKKVG